MAKTRTRSQRVAKKADEDAEPAAAREEVVEPKKTVRKTARSAKKTKKADAVEAEAAPEKKKAAPAKKTPAKAKKTPAKKAKTPARQKKQPQQENDDDDDDDNDNNEIEKEEKKVVVEKEVKEAAKPRSGTKRPRAAIVEEEAKEGNKESDATTETSEEAARAVKSRRLLSYADEVEERKSNKFVTRSVPAGGRWWKKIQNEKASMVIYKANPRTLSTSWDRKMELRHKREAAKAFEAEQRAKREEHEAMMREKRAEKRRRKAENELKGGAFQTINPEKLKRMSKKQLRTISKTQVDNEGNVQTVPVYGQAAPSKFNGRSKKISGKRRR
ncbi:Coiled-coil domain-containing protein 86 [Hondaea fermentalgiana]|uniref:Coiled-coil domain-containing protein 86 n=1 Tax=Hondaea fermentalgiana TaxID=2315210 RepID=A0A2R5GY42_9STRA|nr:Coiled-coil domain-containing protein 86 [Hondaea fermentalgiana]|eukprot:GBG33361.1 Coiled-coil domain-containing protein 86 [Hondaea fermentalgiana]